MPNDTSLDAGPDRSPAVDRLDRGLNLLFAVEVAGDVLEAVDVDEFRRAERIDDVVDVGTLAVALGQPAGRLVARSAVKGVLGGGVAGLVGREIAGRAGARVWQNVLDAAGLEPGSRTAVGRHEEDVTQVPIVDGDGDPDDRSDSDETTDGSGD